MLNSKFAALNFVYVAMITLLALSCISFVGCSKTDKNKKDEVETDKVVTLIQWLKDKDRSVTPKEVELIIAMMRVNSFIREMK